MAAHVGTEAAGGVFIFDPTPVDLGLLTGSGLERTAAAFCLTSRKGLTKSL
ncbi:MAG: hypothetical protein ACM3ZC_10775 [Bacteroidota bacterium]